MEYVFLNLNFLKSPDQCKRHTALLVAWSSTKHKLMFRTINLPGLFPSNEIN